MSNGGGAGLSQAATTTAQAMVRATPRAMTHSQELSGISGWPTIPQVFVKGELVGGADIVEELEASGELEQTLRQKLGDDYAGSRDERTVTLA